MFYAAGDVSSVDFSPECIYFAVCVQGVNRCRKCQVGLKLHCELEYSFQ